MNLHDNDDFRQLMYQKLNKMKNVVKKYGDMHTILSFVIIHYLSKQSGVAIMSSIQRHNLYDTRKNMTFVYYIAISQKSLKFKI